MSEETVFYRRLKEELTRNGKTFNQVERELGYPRNSLNNYKNGNEPMGTRLVELSEYFMVSPAYLVGMCNKSNVFSLKDSFKNLNFEQKRELYSLCESWVLSELYKNN
ncbi:helix-turn-helix domain-containing protein [Lactococcus lactis]|jgi:transcriptional regulator with XRE-family HTH domain|uniref:Helix-turn-helix domain-containing protein n=1 Tax=Lactococcus lactis TaxID=1358 RepID=A0AB35KGJ5_9LACT|nr:helix-turn-helix domain-containing protein [Lactococcus lactis]KST87920.1 transcription regulator [Lactococcus lactis subsp. lactis]KST99752.1 putative transcriptional regulator [Lactococcus lactis subsp. lactis]MBU7532899.1 helix-turn-helix transcriptional regulator [Lactococcus lactis]MCI1072473.1 helix-turn-helix domain-containing protein [Lactococcus lactis]MCT3099371.1 XRE family transcriptional regulator [Lactococcus lactis]